MTPELINPDDDVRLLRSRIGQDFDGECHLLAEEAVRIAATIERLTTALTEIEALCHSQTRQRLLAICEAALSPNPDGGR